MRVQVRQCNKYFAMDFTFVALFLLTLLFTSQAWGGCTTGKFGVSSSSCSFTGCFGGCSYPISRDCELCGQTPSPPSGYADCYYSGPWNWDFSEWCSTHASLNGATVTISIVCRVRCDTQAEADSIAQAQCEQSGGTWNSETKTCIEGAPRDSATFLALYNKCILDFEGKPHYEFNNDGNVVGYCDLCEKSEGDENSEYFGYSNKYVQAYVKAAKYQCCQGQGSIDKYTCLASSGGCYGANCQWNVDGGDIGQSSGKGSCDLSNPVAMGLSCEDYANGNEDEQGAGGSSDSGGGGSSDSGEGTDSTGIDFEYDYNDSLHKIIDSLGAMLAIQRLMLQEFTGQSGGDTIIVNVERDTIINNLKVEVSAPNVYINDSVYKSQIGNLDTILSKIRIQLDNFDSTLRTQFLDTIKQTFNVVGLAVDSIKDFSLKLDSVLFSDLVDSSGYSGGLDSVNKYMGTSNDFDSYSDSIYTAWGGDTINAGFDSSYSYGFCAPNDTNCLIGNGSGLGVGDFMSGDSGVVSELGGKLKDEVENEEDSLPSTWTKLWSEVKQYALFKDFEQKFYSSLGAKIPNSNVCPEHCSQFNVDIESVSWFRDVVVDYKVCTPISSLGNLNVLAFLRVILRILTIVTCLFISMWEVSSNRSRIGF